MFLDLQIKKNRFVLQSKSRCWWTNQLLCISTFNSNRIYSGIMVCINCQHRCNLLCVDFPSMHHINEHTHIVNVVAGLFVGNTYLTTTIKTVLAFDYRIHWGRVKTNNRTHGFCFVFKFNGSGIMAINSVLFSIRLWSSYNTFCK